MSKNVANEADLSEEIAQLRDLLRQASVKIGGETGADDLLRVLDSVGRAAPQLANLLKAQRELGKGGQDPAALLREALAELEAEWPELAECKEALRAGGSSPQEEKHESDN